MDEVQSRIPVLTTLNVGDTVRSPDGRMWRIAWWTHDDSLGQSHIRVVSPEQWDSARELDPRMPI